MRYAAEQYQLTTLVIIEGTQKRNITCLNRRWHTFLQEIRQWERRLVPCVITATVSGDAAQEHATEGIKQRNW